jgi:hypothetical protein
MKNISSLPQEFQNIFAELKAEQDAEQAIDGSELATTKDDIRDEVELLRTNDVDVVDEEDEEQVDMGAVSPAMLAMFN